MFIFSSILLSSRYHPIMLFITPITPDVFSLNGILLQHCYNFKLNYENIQLKS